MSKFRTRHVVWLVLAPTLAVAGAVAVGVLPTQKLGGTSAVVAMAVAGGLSILAIALGSLPVLWAALYASEKLPQVALGATMLRVFILAMVTAPVVILSDVPRLPLLLWVAISYVVALAAETTCVVLLIHRTEGR